jgi:hypothetical protein
MKSEGTVMNSEQRKVLEGLTPEEKAEALEVLGFTRHRHSHQGCCMSLVSSGYICTCNTAPESYWRAPEDVSNVIGESVAECAAFNKLRQAWDEDSNERPPRWSI